MSDLPTKPKVEIQRCSQAHFEKIFTPLKNDSESIYKKLEEFEFKESPMQVVEEKIKKRR